MGDIWRKIGGQLDEFWRNMEGNAEEIKRRLEVKNIVFSTVFNFDLKF